MRLSIFAMSFFVLFGCSEVPPQNPFDPQAPETVQQPANVTGTLWDIRSNCGIQGATVRLAGNNGQHEATSSADGSFVLSGVSRGEYTLTVESDGYRSKNVGQISVNIGNDVAAGEIVMTFETAELNGTVVLDDDQCPEEDTEVIVTASPIGRIGCGTGAADGGVNPGGSSGGVTQVVTVPGRAGGASCGAPVTYSFGQVRSTTWNISATANGYQRRSVSSPAGADAPALVLPINPGTLNGQINLVDRLSVEAGFCLGEQGIPIRYGANEDDLILANCEDGTFSIPNLRQGEYTLQVNATSDNGIAEYAFIERVESINAGAIRQLVPMDLNLVRGALTITINRMGLQNEGGPLEGVLVTLRKNTGDQIATCNGDDPSAPGPDAAYVDVARDRRQVTTGADGLATFTDIVGGSYTVHLSRGTAYNSASNCAQIEFSQDGNQQEALNFDLLQTLSEDPGGIRGSIVFEGLSSGENGPVAEVLIGTPAQRVETNPLDGTYTIGGLPEGDHVLTVRPLNPWSQTHEQSTALIRVTGGLLDKDLGELTVGWKRGTLMGSVSLADPDTLEEGQANVRAVSVILRPWDFDQENPNDPLTGEHVTTPAENGSWRVSDLRFTEAGQEYTVVYEHLNYQTQTSQKNIENDADTVIVTDPMLINTGCVSLALSGLSDDANENFDDARIVLAPNAGVVGEAVDGAATRSGLAPRSDYGVTVSMDGYEITSRQGIRVNPGQSCDSEPVAIEMAYGTGSLTGTVTLEDGADASGVSIIVRHRTAENPQTGQVHGSSTFTDANGQWRLDGLRVGDYEVDIANGNNYLPYTHAQTADYHAVSANAETPLATNLALNRGCGAIQVRVDDPDADLTAARIQLVANEAVVPPDADGILTDANLSPRINYTVSIQLDGYVHETLENFVVTPGCACDDPCATAREVSLTPSTGSLSGTTSLEENDDASGTIITATHRNGAYAITQRTITDASGAWQIENLRVGDYEVTMTQENYVDYDFATIGDIHPVRENAETVVVAELSLNRGCGNLQLTTDDPGLDFSEASITITSGGDNQAGVPPNADGSLSKSGLSPLVDYAITVELDGYVTGSVDGLGVQAGCACEDDGCAAPIIIHLEHASGQMAGTVTLDESDDATGASITATHLVYGTRHNTVANAAGRWSFDLLRVGDYQVTISSGDTYITYDSQTAGHTHTVSEDAETSVVVTLKVNAGCFTGQLTLGDGQDNYEDVHVVLSETGAITVANNDGTFSFGDLMPGTYTIRASLDGYETADVEHRVRPADICVDNLVPMDLRDATPPDLAVLALLTPEFVPLEGFPSAPVYLKPIVDDDHGIIVFTARLNTDEYTPLTDPNFFNAEADALVNGAYWKLRVDNEAESRIIHGDTFDAVACKAMAQDVLNEQPGRFGAACVDHGWHPENNAYNFMFVVANNEGGGIKSNLDANVLHTFTLSAVDSSGLESEATTFQFVLDHKAPSPQPAINVVDGQCSEPVADQFSTCHVSSDALTLNLTRNTSDQNFGCFYLHTRTYEADNPPTLEAIQALPHRTPELEGELSFDSDTCYPQGTQNIAVTAPDEGVATLYCVRAVDQADQSTSSTCIVVTRDTTTPQRFDLFPTEVPVRGATAIIQLSHTLGEDGIPAFDDQTLDDNFSHFELRSNRPGDEFVKQDCGPVGCTHFTVNLQTGATNIFEVRAFDKAGNHSETIVATLYETSNVGFMGGSGMPAQIADMTGSKVLWASQAACDFEGNGGLNFRGCQFNIYYLDRASGNEIPVTVETDEPLTTCVVACGNDEAPQIVASAKLKPMIAIGPTGMVYVDYTEGCGDEDDDQIADDADHCRNVNPADEGESDVDLNGCSDSDNDGDGVPDDGTDECLDSTVLEGRVDEDGDGCSDDGAEAGPFGPPVAIIPPDPNAVEPVLCLGSRLHKTHRVYYRSFGHDGVPNTDDDLTQELSPNHARNSTVYQLKITDKSIAYVRYQPDGRHQLHVHELDSTSDPQYQIKDDTSSYCSDDADCESGVCYLGGEFRLPPIPANQCEGSDHFQGNIVRLDGPAENLGAIDNTYYWVSNLNGIGHLHAWNRSVMPPRVMRAEAPGLNIQFGMFASVDAMLVTLNDQGENDLYQLNTPPDIKVGGRQAVRSILTSAFEEGYWKDTDQRDGEDGCVCDVDDVPPEALENGQQLICVSAVQSHTASPIRQKACVTVNIAGTFGCRANNQSWCGPVSSPDSDGLSMTWVTTRTSENTHVDEYELWAAQLSDLDSDKRLSPALVSRQSGALTTPRIFLDSMLYLDHQSGRPRIRLAEPGAQNWVGLTMDVDQPKENVIAGLKTLIYTSYGDSPTPGLYLLSTNPDQASLPPRNLFELLPNNEHLLSASEQSSWMSGAGYLLTQDTLIVAARINDALVGQLGEPCLAGQRPVYRIYQAQLTGALSNELAAALGNAAMTYVCANEDLQVTGIQIGASSSRQAFYSLQTVDNNGGGLYWMNTTGEGTTTYHLSAGVDPDGRDCKHVAVQHDDNGTDAYEADDSLSIICAGFTSEQCTTANGNIPLDPSNVECWDQQFARLYVLSPRDEDGQCGSPVCEGETQGPALFARNPNESVCLTMVPLRSVVDGFSAEAVKGYINDVSISDGEKNLAFELIDGEIKRIYMLAPNSIGSYISDARETEDEDCVGSASPPTATQVFVRSGENLGRINLSNRFLILADAGQAGQPEILRIRVTDESIERLTVADSAQTHPSVNQIGEIFYVDSRYRETALGEEIFSPAITRRFTLDSPQPECSTHAECEDLGGYCNPQSGICSVLCDDADQCGVNEECGVPKNVACGAAGPLRTCLAPGAINPQCAGCVPQAEVCDGQDNDCDDVIDEDIAVAPIQCGVGVCLADGVTRCVNGNPVDVCDEGEAALEACDDTLDNDCDGTADEANCEGGQPACVPQEEVCDGQDNDCDERVDELIEPVATQCGQGICSAQGQRTCSAGQLVDSCQEGAAVVEACNDQLDNDCDGDTDEANCAGGEEPCVPGPEVCDGADNDCDDTVDEGIAPIPSQCGTGACAAQGQITCVAGNPVDSCQAGLPEAEVCDGTDNDCDGQPDEDIASVPTQCGVGACAALGEQTCVGGDLVNSCQSGVAGVEVCDGEDNDCDASTDEGIAPVATQCGVGACGAAGEETCVNAELVDSCQEGAPGAELCGDGIDNNCADGIDEPGCEGQPQGGPCLAHTDCANNALCHTGNNTCLALCPLDGCPENQTCTVPSATTCEAAGTRRTCAPDAFSQDCDGPAGNTCNFEEHIQPIFDANCTACHAGAFPASSLDLGAGVSYDNLVGQPSISDNQLMLVTPNSEATSFLWNKVTTNEPLHGVRMPRNQPRLPQETLSNIRDWIMGGAPNGDFSCP